MRTGRLIEPLRLVDAGRGAVVGVLEVVERRWVLLGAPLVFVVGLLAVRSPHRAVELVLAVAVVALVFWRLLAGLVVFTLLTFPAHLPASFGAGATLAKPFGALIVIAWIGALLRDRTMPLLVRDWPLVVTALFAYFLWALLSAVWATDSGRAIGSATRLAQVIVLVFVAYSTVRSRSDLRVLLWAYAGAAFITASYALGSGQTYEGRLTGGVNDPNYLAAELVPAILIGGFLLGSTRRPAARAVLLAFTATSFVAFAATQSRGGALALAAALLVAVVLAGPVRTLTIAMVLVAVGLAVSYYEIIAPAAVRARVTDISTNASSGRTDSWQIATRMVEAHPLTGVGLSNFPVMQEDYLPSNVNLQLVKQIVKENLVVHNTYLETAAELGLIGFMLLLLVIGTIIGLAIVRLPALTRADPEGKALPVRGLIAGLVGLLVGYVFLSGEYEKQLWLLLALTAAAAGLAERRPEVGRDRQLEP